MKSLRIKFPFGITFLFAIGWLVLLIGGLEIIARQPGIQAKLPAQGFGSAHRQFEVQLDRLGKRYRAEGQIDCLIIGNSHAARGINPEFIETSIAEKMGEDIICQNFGLNSIDMRLAQEITTILVNEYHPRFIILAVSYMDFDNKLGGLGNPSIEATPWFRWKSGKPDPDGWTVDHSFAYRYYLSLHDTFFRGKSFHQDERGIPFESIYPNGHFPSAKVFDFSNLTSAAPQDLVAKFWYLEEFGKIVIEPFEVESFSVLLADTTPVFVVETPFLPLLYSASQESAARHNQFISLAAQLTARYNRPFLPTQGIVSIPDDGWLDFKHLNQSGAETFSQWLGEQIAGNQEFLQQIESEP
jgi:hypothetical protein